jgi:tetratricopeptide (TPR) repeat protein
MQKSWISKLPVFVTILVAWVVGLKKLIEPDMWWYLKTGKWIVTNSAVPKEDMFSYSFSGVEWINVKWLYEVIVYGFSQIGGPEFTSVFQAMVGFFIVLTIVGIVRPITPKISGGAIALVLIPVLLVVSYRMTARPETISHLFSLLAILIFVLHKYKSPKWLYAWIPLQLLWTNLHEAYATGLVIMLALVGTEFIIKFIEKKKIINTTHLIAIGASILAVSVNPRGFYMLIHPFEIFSQLGQNKFTMELFSASTDYYWQQWQSWFFVFTILVTTAVIAFSEGKDIKASIQNHVKQFSTGYFVVLVLFAYLGFTAYRNIPFFMLAVSPFLIVNLGGLLQHKSNLVNFGSLAFGLIAYLAVVSNIFYELTNSRNRYGLEVDSGYNPIALANAIEKLDYKQPHFSDYLSSAYPMWAIDDYETFIDLRDLDVFPESFFQEMILATQHYPTFIELAELNKMQYAYIKRSDFMGLIGQLHQDTNWRMVFADPMAVLFTKTPDSKLKDLFGNFSELEVSSISIGMSKLFNPLYSQKPHPININLMASSFYMAIGELDLALSRVSNINDPNYEYEKLCALAEVYDQKSLIERNDSLLQLGWNALTQASAKDPNRAKAYELMGMMFYKRGQYTEALPHFKKSIKKDPNQASIWSFMADCQNSFIQQNPGNQKFVDRWFEYMTMAHQLAPTNSVYTYRLGISYCDRNDCKKATPFLEKLGPLPFLSDAENQEIVNCQKRCGVNPK